MTTVASAVASARSWSEQQNRIYTWFAVSSACLYLIVRARAGTGKTTTIIEGINRAPESKILLCAFNKRIAEELTARITNPNAVAKTLHALGLACVTRYKPGVKILKGDERAMWLANEVCGPKAPETIVKLVARLHSKGREIVPHATVLGELTNVAIDFECEPDEAWAADGYDLAYVETKALAAMELASKDIARGIDFSDMLFLPVRNRWMSKTYDLVVVDEAQDMTVAQLELARGVCKGRIVVVGDDRQAIYGFRGADSNSLDRLKTELQAEELGLTTTYRCGKVIVREAQRLVPDFEAGDGNSDGEIINLAGDKLVETANLGDFILSRLNAPLVSIAMSLLRNGKRTRIAGRDVGAGLKSLVRKLAKGNAAHSIPAFCERVSNWESKEVDRMTKANRLDRIEGIHDQAEMLISLTGNARSVSDIGDRIDALFTDDGLGQAGVITCSSVHRSKGLEANRVFVLRDTLRGGDIEEENIEYVAITRAKETLVWVSSKAVA